MKKLLLLTLILCLTTLGALAKDVWVKSYLVDVAVHENNTLDIVEEVTVHFDEPRHGFYRYVPYKYYMFGKSYRCDITDVKVSGDNYSLKDENDNLLVKIGDANRTVTGDKTYSISYRIKYRDDRLKDRDMFYQSIIGQDFELDIDTLCFSVIFDKKLPDNAEEKLKVFSGPVGSKENELNADVWMNGDSIFGIATDIKQKNALTLQLTLPEGYFVGMEKAQDASTANMLIYVTLFLAAVLIYFALTIKKPVIISSIEYYPPEDMCSAEVGTIIDGSVDPIDLGSMIPWFASKGYVKLEEFEKKKLFGKKTVIKMTKLKGLPGNAPEYQKTFFKAMFSEGNEVNLDEMPKVPEEMKKTKKQLAEKFTGEKALSTWHKATWLILAMMITGTLALVYSLPYAFDNDDYFQTLLLFTIPFALGAMRLYGSAEGIFLKTKKALMTRRILRAALMMLMCWCYTWMCEDQLIDKTMIYVVFIVCFIATEMMVRLNTSTPYRAELMCKLLGLKEYIQVAEKQQLEMMLNDDPQYFFRILPYAIVLEVSDVWAEHFRGIQMEEPEYYHTNDITQSLATGAFVSSLASASTNAISCMSPTSIDLGVVGGASGGGGGGGGGGAW